MGSFTAVNMRVIGYLLFALLGVLGVLPIFSMIASTLYDTHGFSLHRYALLLGDSSLVTSLQHSLLLGFCVAFLSTFVGIVLGVLLSKTNLLWRSVWMGILLIPLIVPPYIIAYGWYGLIGRQTVLGDYLFGFTGTLWVLFTVYLSIPTLLTALFLRQINPHLEEAGLLLCPWRCVLRKITLPLAQPALVFSFLLVFVLSISELSVANFLRYDVFPLHSFTQFSAFYDFKTATVYTMPLLLIVLLILFLGMRLPYKSLHFKSPKNIHLIDVSAYHHILFLALLLFIILLIGLPLLGLFRHIDLSSFLTAFYKSLPALKQSLFYALSASFILLVFGFLSANVIVYRQCKGWQWLQGTLLFFFILSSVLLGIGLILFWNNTHTNFIYATPLIVFIAYLLKYLFLSTSIIQLKLKQIPHSLLDAATLAGASSRQVIVHIILPLSKEALMIAMLVGFIFTLRESTLTMLVSPAGTSTLPVYIMTQMANGKESIVASLCLIMILTVLLPLFGLLHYVRHKETLA